MEPLDRACELGLIEAELAHADVEELSATMVATMNTKNSIFFEIEREFTLEKNTPAPLQKTRPDFECFQDRTHNLTNQEF